MRPSVLLVSALVATFTLALAPPTASAMVERCSSLAHADCPGLVCTDANGDHRFEAHECTAPKDLLDTCQFQSDCCRGVGSQGLWCPEDS